MNVLLVTAHPLPDSLCAALAERAAAALAGAGHSVVREDLYAQARAHADGARLLLCARLRRRPACWRI